MNKINWSGRQWIPQERWGLIHPEKKYAWYDESAVNVLDNGNLQLKTHKNPRYFPELNVTSNIGMGLVSCLDRFKYGIYEISAKLPRGKNLWSAFWMWSWDTHPPEIDVFEAYSNNFGSYFTFNPFKPYKVETSIHYFDNGQKTSHKGATHWWGFKNPTKHFIKYRLEWRNDSVKYFYDNKLVKIVTDKNILEQLDATTMNVIINNHPRENMSQSNPTNSVFEVEYFNYEKI